MKAIRAKLLMGEEERMHLSKTPPEFFRLLINLIKLHRKM